MVLGLLTLLWIVQAINNALGYKLSINYGIEPHVGSSLPYIFTAPFLHWSWVHVEGNSIPFLVLGFLAALRGIRRFLWVTVAVIIASGLFAWSVSPVNADTVGASGVIFGWFGYVIVRGFFNRNKVDLVIGFVVGIYYFSFLSLLFPAPHLSYEGHIGGILGGLLCGWVFREPTDDPRHAQGNAIHGAPPPPALSTSPSHIEDELAALKAELRDERQ